MGCLYLFEHFGRSGFSGANLGDQDYHTHSQATSLRVVPFEPGIAANSCDVTTVLAAVFVTKVVGQCLQSWVGLLVGGR